MFYNNKRFGHIHNPRGQATPDQSNLVIKIQYASIKIQIQSNIRIINPNCALYGSEAIQKW